MIFDSWLAELGHRPEETDRTNRRIRWVVEKARSVSSDTILRQRHLQRTPAPVPQIDAAIIRHHYDAGLIPAEFER